MIWAYPVTAEETPHQVRIDGGERRSRPLERPTPWRCPFVQGRLLERGPRVATDRDRVRDQRTSDRLRARQRVSLSAFVRLLRSRCSSFPMIDIRNLDAPCIVDDF